MVTRLPEVSCTVDVSRQVAPVERRRYAIPKTVALDATVRQRLSDPHVLMMPHLLVTAWGRKPE